MRTAPLRPRTATIALATTALAATLTLSACSQVEEAVNRGGDTQCNDYIGQDKDTQRVTVTKYLKDQENGTEPTANQVDMSMAAIDALCRVQNNAQVPIKDANLMGILPSQ
ncbi:MAG: hypothetical protein WAW85_02930 [Gordonia sp. (in: high G+C Gram-positive bacteria)]|uniref:hypothetical protein n=1 Tax=Gordonia sp. (in: high G+C Gram-positive bacteria) TaxID=84139 RepID=UPI003BB6AD22